MDVLATSAPILRGWRDQSGLWRIPVVDNDCDDAHQSQVEEIQLPAAQIHHLYHLPSVEAWVAYIHACLGFPTKAALLEAAAAGRLIGIPFATVTNLRRFYPETTETPKGHMNQQKQGTR